MRSSLRPRLRAGIALALAALAGPSTWADSLTQDEVLKTLGPGLIELRLPESTPEAYFYYTNRLLVAGDMESALRWYYVGKLRAGVYVKTHPGLDPNQEPAHLSSLSHMLGQALLHYEQTHVDRWAGAIDAALAWDQAHDNGPTPKGVLPAVYAGERSELAALRTQVIAQRDAIAAHAETGEPMPKAWPALVPVQSCRDLAGQYDTLHLTAPLVPLLQGRAASPKHRPSATELVALADNQLQIIETRYGVEVGRLTVEATISDGAVAIALPDTLRTRPIGGGSKGTLLLRLNAARELVVERQGEFEGYVSAGTTAPIEFHRYWDHAAPLKSGPSTAP